MRDSVIKKACLEYFFILVGAFLMAYAIKAIFNTMNMVTGGVSGIAIIVKHLTRNINILGEHGVPLWLTNTIVNIPLFIFAYKYKGKRFIKRTVITTSAVTVFLGVIPNLTILPKDNLLNTIVGGALMGTGLGLVFARGSTTGGTDLLAALINLKIRHLSIPNLLLLIDSIIIVLGSLVFGLEKAMYSTIAIYLSTTISDNIIEGPKHSKMAYIISDKAKEISDEIIKILERGVTGISIVGMYTRDEKNMLMCVVSKKEIVTLKEIVVDYDENAFVIVSDVREALGEGFIRS